MCDGLRTLVSYNKPASAERFSFQPVTTLAYFVSALPHIVFIKRCFRNV